MEYLEQPYLNLLQHVLNHGDSRNDRTNTGTLSVFGGELQFDLEKGFPIVTTKKINFYAVITELLWFIKGGTNTKFLNEHGVKIWDEWADKNGNLGPIYGAQWRKWKHGAIKIDQLTELIDGIKTNPYSRRHILSAWNVGELDKMALPPCHLLAQFYVANSTLSCKMYQRSADLFLGVPFNIASYALLTHLIAHVCDLNVGKFIHSFGDAHIYHNHITQVKKQLTRIPYESPTLYLNPEVKDITEFEHDDIAIYDYKCHPFIHAPIAV